MSHINKNQLNKYPFNKCYFFMQQLKKGTNCNLKKKKKKVNNDID